MSGNVGPTSSTMLLFHESLPIRILSSTPIIGQNDAQHALHRRTQSRVSLVQSSSGSSKSSTVPLKRSHAVSGIAVGYTVHRDGSSLRRVRPKAKWDGDGDGDWLGAARRLARLARPWSAFVDIILTRCHS